MNAKKLMRAYLLLSPAEQSAFQSLQASLSVSLEIADHLPHRHPEKASRRWRAVKNFRKAHGL